MPTRAAPTPTMPFTDLNKNNHYRRGFTGHEHLNEQQLIHMNGRLYDYNFGRFLSVDPFIQSSANTQSVNPYVYIMNNPLAGTDPTGYLVESVCGHHGAEYYCNSISYSNSTPQSDEGDEKTPRPSTSATATIKKQSHPRRRPSTPSNLLIVRLTRPKAMMKPRRHP